MTHKTAYVTHKRYNEHTMSGHPEHAGRLSSVWQHIKDAALTERLTPLKPQLLAESTILLAHDAELLNSLGNIESLIDSRLYMLNPDTYMVPNSYTIARLAAGGVCAAVDAVMDGETDNALVAVRPPGHHATPSTAMGFCLLNNIAIGARHAQDTHGINRVMIVDYDVHHGNGTQDIFYFDEDVLFLSTHQSPLFPGTGMLQEIGEGPGAGTTINVPLRAGTGDKSLAQIYHEVVWPAAERFQPELIMVSAGFDAHWRDPIGGMRLTLNGFDHLTRELMAMADKLCDGKIVFVMEGGYDLEVIGMGMMNVARALLGDDKIEDPLGPAPMKSEPKVERVIASVKNLHNLD